MSSCAIAVVVLNYNGSHLLSRYFLDVLRHSISTKLYNVGVYVVDNHSTDNSMDFLSSCLSSDRIISFSHNKGYAQAYNDALASLYSKGYDYYILLNNDVSVGEGWLMPLVSFMEGEEEAGACQPKICSMLRSGYFDYAGASGGYVDVLGFPFCRGRVVNHIERDRGQYDNVCRIGWASGACLMVRAAAFKKVGGFCSAFFMHMEEVDFCWRLYGAGYGVYVVPTSVVYHVGGASLGFSHPQKTYFNVRNSLWVLRRNASYAIFRIMARLFTDILMLIYLLCIRPPHAWAVVRAWRDGCRPMRHRVSGKISGYKNYPYYRGLLLWGYFICHRRFFRDYSMENM